MRCQLITSADHFIEGIDAIVLGEVTKDISELARKGISVYAFPPSIRAFAFGRGIDGYRIGKKMFWTANNPKETRISNGMDLGWTEFIHNEDIWE